MSGVLGQRNTWLGLGGNPSDVCVSYEWKYNTLTISLGNRRSISVPISVVRELEGVKQEEINEGTISSDGSMVCWERLGLYINLEDLMYKVGVKEC